MANQIETQTFEYAGVNYPCRTITDQHSPDNGLLVVSSKLLDVISMEDGSILKEAEHVDEEIFYYASEQEMQMDEKELFNLICGEQTTDLNISWINGKHSEFIEIDTAHSTVSIHAHFWQGEEADEVIKEISKIYNAGDLSALDACEIWAGKYL